jgi:exosortase
MICGWDVMKIAWFPIAFLICAVPWPGLVYSKVAGPLQQLAAEIASGTLRLTGVEAARAGTKIFIGDPLAGNVRTLNVAEACAGMRSLMTFIALGAAIAFLSARPLWQRIVITLSAIPIAILCNVLRVTGTGVLDHYWSQEISEGFSHQFVGMVMLVPAFLLLLLVGWILDQILVEEAEAAPLLIKKSAQPGVIRVNRRSSDPEVSA